MAKAKKSKARKSKAKKSKAKKAKKSTRRAAAASRGKTRKTKAKKSKARKAKKVARKAAKPKAKAKKTVSKAAPKKKKQIVGEGDYRASRSFLKDEAAFVKRHSAEIPAMGKDAEAALEGPEGGSLRAAEEEALSHSKAPGE
jgi:histone H1/5